MIQRMALSLNSINEPVSWSLLQRGSRVFGLLGKATSAGVTPFGPQDVGNAWALTAEFGCLRLERLTGDEEITGGRLVLPTAYTYDYGIADVGASADTVRGVFGLLPSELECLVTVLRRGGFPVLGYSRTDLTCGVSSCVIPASWPHVVISNTAVCGNVVSVETFVRLMVSSLSHGQLASRFPGLQPVLRPMVRLMIAFRRGLPYQREVLTLSPALSLVSP